VGRRMHSSPVKTVSGAVSVRAPTQFFMAVYGSTGAVGADESIDHM